MSKSAYTVNKYSRRIRRSVKKTRINTETQIISLSQTDDKMSQLKMAGGVHITMDAKLQSALCLIDSAGQKSKSDANLL